MHARINSSDKEKPSDIVMASSLRVISRELGKASAGRSTRRDKASAVSSRPAEMPPRGTNVPPPALQTTVNNQM